MDKTDGEGRVREEGGEEGGEEEDKPYTILLETGDHFCHIAHSHAL